MFRSDGVLLGRSPHSEAAIGQKGTQTIPFLDIWSVPEGEDQLSSLQALTHYPVVVSVTTSRLPRSRSGRGTRRPSSPRSRLAGLSIGGFILLIVHRLMQGIRRSRERVRGQKLQLDIALNNMSQGLLLCDAQDRVILCNKRYMEIYGVPADMVARGSTRWELIKHHFATGLMAGDPEQYMSAARKTSHSRTVETTDGRTISVIGGVIEGGFRVTTHEDITDRRRAEQERDRNRDFLDRIIDNIPVTVFVKDARSLQYILVNRAGEKLWGLSREEVVGKTPHEIFDKETADIIVAHDREMLHSERGIYVRSIRSARRATACVWSPPTGSACAIRTVSRNTCSASPRT